MRPRARLPLSLLGWVALSLSGCLSSETRTYACGSHGDCARDFLCIAKACVPAEQAPPVVVPGDDGGVDGSDVDGPDVDGGVEATGPAVRLDLDKCRAPRTPACVDDATNLLFCYDRFDAPLAESDNGNGTSHLRYADGRGSVLELPQGAHQGAAATPSSWMSLRGDGIVDGAAVTRVPLQDTLDAMTFVAMVRLHSLPAAGARFGVYDRDAVYGMFIDDTGALTCRATNADGSDSATVRVAGALALETWTLVVCGADAAQTYARVGTAAVSLPRGGQAVLQVAGRTAVLMGNHPSGERLDGDVAFAALMPCVPRACELQELATGARNSACDD